MNEEKFTFFWNGPFSQWHIAPFKVDNVEYNCCEQYMMAQKAIIFNDEEMLRNIMANKNPRDQKAYGRRVKNFDPVIWNSKAKEIVYKGNYAKFTQNSKLFSELMKTKGTTLVEASPYDKIWGVGLSENDALIQQRNTWKGTNCLGEILTKVREDINKTWKLDILT